MMEAMDNSNLRPVADTSDTLNVILSWNLVSINDFDESNGYIELGGFFTASWTAAGHPDTSSYGIGYDSILYTKIWTPPLMVLNSLTYSEEIGHQAKARVRYNFDTKACLWSPWLTTRIGCSPNVQYYPYDKQSCIMRVSMWGYESSEVSLIAGDSKWTFDFFEENGEWQIDSTSIVADHAGSVSVLAFSIEISRRPLYYVINLVAPLILLGVLNSFAFLLPTASGERIGFSVTCFLSYVVLLNMIMDFLPTSAAPMSYLSYYTFIMMVFSGGVTLVTILTVSIYHKHGEGQNKPVPNVLRYMYLFFTCKCCKYLMMTSDSVTPMKTGRVGDAKGDDMWSDTVSMATSHEDSEQTEITWENIANFLDWFFFCGFLGGQIFFSVAYLLPIFMQ